jgi:hypothetical protein
LGFSKFFGFSFIFSKKKEAGPVISIGKDVSNGLAVAETDFNQKEYDEGLNNHFSATE